MVSACTIVARNYLPHARILIESFFAHHPDGDFTLLLIDDEGRTLNEDGQRFTCRRLSEIGLSRKTIGQLAAIYDVTELATAVKPPLLQHLLGEGREHVLYLDPDIKIYGSLDEPARLAREHGIVLTPHTMTPFPVDGQRVDDFHILGSGVYNLGFIGVGRSAAPFLAWWWSKTERQALMDPEHMMFTDQRWVDFVPSLFDHALLKDPGYNVAYWNLHGRDFAWTDDRYLVDGRPLRFFHFSGFSTKKPYLLSKHQGTRPRILLSEHPALARICREYAADLLRVGLADQALPYGWDTLPSGLFFDHRMRRLYRAGLERFEKGQGPEPPAPFEDEAGFLAWLNELVAIGLRPRVSRYLQAVYLERQDLQRVFPDLSGSDCDRFFDWLRGDGVTQGIAAALMPRDRPAPGLIEAPYASPSALIPGVNLAGYFRAELGVGEAARLLRSAAEHAGIPHSTLSYEVTDSRRDHRFEERGDGTAPFDINIVCVNADRTADFARDAGPGFYRGRYTVGYWFWELEQFPGIMHRGFDFVDEVWAATRFVAHGIDRIGRRPVHVIPLAVPIPRCSPDVTRASLGLPSGFLFLFVFDFFSILERKNPLGLIAAFKQAFRPGEGPTLVLKSINGKHKLNDLERVRDAASDRPDILIIDEYYSAEEKNTLLSLCDCYVSLHRSEGLGLTMAEAMGLKKPVIATAYSGNLDFMTSENSYLVDYVSGGVPADSDPYPQGSPWAEPTLTHAAELMRRVYEAGDEAAARAARAQQDILMKHNVEVSATALEQRLNAIRRTRESVPVSGAATATDGPLDAEAPAISPAFDQASSLLTPTSSAPTGVALRGLRLAAQNLLFRILRPYWQQQRQLQTILLDGLQDATTRAARAAAVEPHQRRAIESVWTALHAVEARLIELERAATDSQQSAAASQTAVDAHLTAVTERTEEDA